MNRNKTQEDMLFLFIVMLIGVTYWSQGFEPTVIMLLMVISWYVMEIVWLLRLTYQQKEGKGDNRKK